MMNINFLLFHVYFCSCVDIYGKNRVSKHDDAWYYVQFERDGLFEVLQNLIGISIDNILPVSDKIFTISLSRRIAKKIIEIPGIRITKIPSSDKKPKSISKLYYAISQPNCSLPGEIITKYGLITVFKYEGSINKLAKIVCARVIQPYTNSLTFHSRFHRSITHDWINSNQYHTNQVELNSPLYKRNITGANQCIAVVDTGVDVNNPWLKSNISEQSKVRTYWGIADDVDADEGHGTFMAGVAAGKSKCHPLSSLYNGVAYDSQILPVDIHKKSTNHFMFPANLSDMYEAPLELGCPISLNTWTNGDQLMTTVIDYLAYRNPEILFIFPAVMNQKGIIDHPADSKNALTVGSVHGVPSSNSVDDPTIPIMVFCHGTNSMIIGYGDESGAPFLNHSDHGFKEYHNILIGDGEDCIAVILDERTKPDSYPDVLALLVFHSSPISGKFTMPIIRMPPERKNFFTQGSIVSMFVSQYGDDDLNGIFRISNISGYRTKSTFLIKPDIVVPGGPIIGPKAGSSECSMLSLTLKAGPSVSSSIAAGDAALIRQFLTKKLGIPSINSTLIRAMFITSASDLSDVYGELPTEQQGWGVPQLEKIMFPGKGFSTYIQQSITIEKENRLDFCFTATSAGFVTATIVWNDYPRDPTSFSSITTPLILTASTEKNSQSHILSNIKKEDFPTIDIFNTVKRVDIPVAYGTKVRISVIAGKFEYLNTVNFSMVIHGPFDLNSNINLSCNGYFESSPCPRQCEGGRGATCLKSKLCYCPADRGGDFCGFRSEKAPVGHQQYVEALRKFEWRLMKVFPEKWGPNTSLILDTSNIDFEKTGILINVGRAPRWNEYLCTNVHCPWADTLEKSMSFSYNEWDFVTKANPFVFGFFGKSETPISFEVRYDLITPQAQSEQ